MRSLWQGGTQAETKSTNTSLLSVHTSIKSVHTIQWEINYIFIADRLNTVQIRTYIYRISGDPSYDHDFFSTRAVLILQGKQIIPSPHPHTSLLYFIPYGPLSPSLFIISFIYPSCCHFLLSPISPVRLNHTGKTFTIHLLTPSCFFTYHQGLTLKNSTWFSLGVEGFVRISEQTATFTLYSINWLVFITVVESVYSAVRTDSLYKADYASSSKG